MVKEECQELRDQQGIKVYQVLWVKKVIKEETQHINHYLDQREIKDRGVNQV